MSPWVGGDRELVEWTHRFDELGVRYSPIADVSYGSVLVFRDPDNIQLEMIANPGGAALYGPSPVRGSAGGTTGTGAARGAAT